MPGSSHCCLLSFLSPGPGSSHSPPRSDFPTCLQRSLHRSHLRAVRTITPRVPCSSASGAGQAGNAVPPASFSIGRGRRSGRGPLRLPRPPAARVVPSSPGSCHCQAFQPWMVRGFEGMGWGGGGKGQGAQTPGSWKCLGTGRSRALGRLPRRRRSAAVASLPHLRFNGGPLGTPSADNTEALPLGWGVSREEKKADKEREQQTQNR